MGRTVIDLDAARGEDTPIRVILLKQEWELPPELPAAVLDPLFDGDLDDLLAALVELLDDEQDPDGGDGTRGKDSEMGAFVRAIRRNPGLVSTMLRALRGAYAQLLGPEQWQRWLDARPGLTSYLLLGKTALKEYGVSLGELWASSRSSDTGGATSRPTVTGMEPMPDGFGSPLGIRD